MKKIGYIRNFMPENFRKRYDVLRKMSYLIMACVGTALFVAGIFSNDHGIKLFAIWLDTVMLFEVNWWKS